MATTAQGVSFGTAPLTVVSHKKRAHPLRNLLFVMMLVFTLFWLLPIFGSLYTALRTQGDITANGFWSLPREITFGNFAAAWEMGRVSRYLGNSFIITIPSLIGTLFLSSLAAF